MLRQSSRGHYTDSVLHAFKRRGQTTRRTWLPPGNDRPTEGNPVDVPAGWNRRYVYSVPEGMSSEQAAEDNTYDRATVEVDFSRGPNEKPRGTGWRWVDDRTYEGGEGGHWRRPKMSMQTVETAEVSEITVSGGRGMPYVDGRLVTATHELGHRFQHRVPRRNAMERSGRERRILEDEAERAAAEPPSSLSEVDAETIYEGTSEKGSRDHFVDHYIGKSYDHRIGSEGVWGDGGGKADGFTCATEVFSMGSESVLVGSHGALVGMCKEDADPDMRHFVLGVLATAGAKRRS